MSRMTALAELLDQTEELLDHADAQTITESLERGEAPDFDIRRQFEPCPWCGHGFHGLGCAPVVDFLTATLAFVDEEEAIDDASMPLEHPLVDEWHCRCDSALDPPDDTWRPIWSGNVAEKRRHDIAWHRRKTGLDGWSAAADLDRRRRARDVAFREIADQVVAAGRVIVTAFDEIGALVLAPMAAALERMHFEVVPTVPFRAAPAELEPTEETAADRALRLRQTRHTGPERPPANRAHRPRRHQ